MTRTFASDSYRHHGTHQPTTSQYRLIIALGKTSRKLPWYSSACAHSQHGQAFHPWRVDQVNCPSC
ncbi:hypothetical protein B0T16DRAFT_398704 [Cercophora newfieldiana]|uniref:Uncharacterized protein n=1 Tax=Cercophora newfieldiana TaxID=92897 RepID=A0AA39YP56_9PEZI|nr:hypothetical protein B0T16DRAFT_398704 [Cercophora newfieldiana]